MLDTEFNQLTLKKRIGSDVIRITIGDFLEKIKKIQDANVEKAITELNPLMPHPQKELNIKFKECMKIFVAIRDWITEENIDALAFRCWPELKDRGIYCPCLALSLIGSTGVQASCEGDIPGALSMLLLSSLSREPSYLSDLTRIEEKEKAIYYFHCGAAAPQLAQENTIHYKCHTYSAWNPGITVEFPLKPGPITFARIEELLDGSYMLVTYCGEAVKTGMVCAGNPMKAKFETSPTEIVKKLVNSGSGHHQVCTYGNFTKELKIIAEMLNIKFLEAEK
jgi:L-fucose isomerase-like protein